MWSRGQKAQWGRGHGSPSPGLSRCRALSKDTPCICGEGACWPALNALTLLILIGNCHTSDFVVSLDPQASPETAASGGLGATETSSFLSSVAGRTGKGQESFLGRLCLTPFAFGISKGQVR